MCSNRNMGDSEVLSRRKKTKVRHRASASRVINQVYNLLDDPELNQSKLKQSYQALTEKLAVFDKFDGKIL